MSDDMIYDAAADLCSHGVKNGAMGKEPWLKDRYLRVRYQDVSDADSDCVLFFVYCFFTDTDCVFFPKNHCSLHSIPLM